MTWGIPQALARLRSRLRCPAWCIAFKKRFDEIVFHEQSTTTRLFFGATTLGFGSFFWFSPTVHHPLSEYALMLTLAPDWVWASAFTVNGVSLVVGAWTNKFSKAHLFLEGTLGVIVWWASAYCVVKTQGAAGAHVMGAAIAFWVYIRHPEVKKGES